MEYEYISLKKYTSNRYLTSSVSLPLNKTDVFATKDFFSPDFVNQITSNITSFAQTPSRLLMDPLVLLLHQIERSFESILSQIKSFKESLIVSVVSSHTYDDNIFELEVLRTEIQKCHEKIRKNSDYHPLVEELAHLLNKYKIVKNDHSEFLPDQQLEKTYERSIKQMTESFEAVIKESKNLMNPVMNRDTVCNDEICDCDDIRYNNHFIATESSDEPQVHQQEEGKVDEEIILRSKHKVHDSITFKYRQQNYLSLLERTTARRAKIYIINLDTNKEIHSSYINFEPADTVFPDYIGLKQSELGYMESCQCITITDLVKQNFTLYKFTSSRIIKVVSIPLAVHFGLCDFHLTILDDYFTIAYGCGHHKLTFINVLSKRVVVSKEDCWNGNDIFKYIQDLNFLVVFIDDIPSRRILVFKVLNGATKLRVKYCLLFKTLRNYLCLSNRGFCVELEFDSQFDRYMNLQYFEVSYWGPKRFPLAIPPPSQKQSESFESVWVEPIRRRAIILYRSQVVFTSDYKGSNFAGSLLCGGDNYIIFQYNNRKDVFIRRFLN